MIRVASLPRCVYAALSVRPSQLRRNAVEMAEICDVAGLYRTNGVAIKLLLLLEYVLFLSRACLSAIVRDLSRSLRLFGIIPVFPQLRRNAEAVKIHDTAAALVRAHIG